MINQILNVFNKERLDLLRDKRTVFASLSFALFGPLTLVLMLNFVANIAEDETAPKLVVYGAEYAPNLIRHIKGRGIEVIKMEEKPGMKGLFKDYDAYLSIDEDYGKELKAGKITSVELFIDKANVQKMAKARDIQINISRYGRSIGEGRLITLGVPPSITTPFIIETRDVSIGGAGAKSMSFAILLYFLMAPFFSSMSVSIDITAGERERKSLQTLLAQPVTPTSLILGKWALAACFGMFGTAISVLGGLFAIGISPIEVLGMRLYLDFGTQLQLLLVLFPLCWFVAGAQILIALTAKSYKEANAYLQVFSILPALMAVPIMLKGSNFEGLPALAPVISHLQLAQGLLVEGKGNWSLIAIATIISILLAIGCLFFASKRLGHEKILSAA